MSSGEADVYTFKIPELVKNVSNSTTVGNIQWGGSNHFDIVDWGTNHYYYQVRCPRCHSMNWAELNTVITCNGTYSQERRPGGKKWPCEARIRVVDQSVDYDVEVEK